MSWGPELVGLLRHLFQMALFHLTLGDKGRSRENKPRTFMSKSTGGVRNVPERACFAKGTQAPLWQDLSVFMAPCLGG